MTLEGELQTGFPVAGATHAAAAERAVFLLGGIEDRRLRPGDVCTVRPPKLFDRMIRSFRRLVLGNINVEYCDYLAGVYVISLDHARVCHLFRIVAYVEYVLPYLKKGQRKFHIPCISEPEKSFFVFRLINYLHKNNG